MKMSRGWFVVLVAAIALPGATQVVADSVRDFSGRQGERGWYYGFYFRSADRDLAYNADRDFRLMEQHIAERQPGARMDYVPIWHQSDPEYWTWIHATTMHPNGTFTTTGRRSAEVWPVRRWVSTVQGHILVEGSLAKNLAGGNGLVGRLFVDGREVWSRKIEGDDAIGVEFAVPVVLKVGSWVDFAVDPFQSADRSDHARVTFKIRWNPDRG